MRKVDAILIAFFDLFFTSIALVVLSPLLIIVMLILKFTGEREVFYLQPRVGKNGKFFGLLKFVTMVKNSSNMGTGTITIKDDPRVLPVGKLLRKTKINELPQLFNILKGDMSLIGPRPQTEACFKAFSEESQTTIIKMKPGLSGIGSIVFRNEEEMLDGDKIQDKVGFYDKVIAPYKGKLEEWYYQKQSAYLYLSLIFLTLWVVVFPKTKWYFRVFKDLPMPPKELEEKL